MCVAGRRCSTGLYMYQEKIIAYLEAHKEEMLRDICDLVRINSEKLPAKDGMPFGEGNAQVLALALEKAKGYGFAVQNYENYVGSVDFSDAPKQLDILAHLDVVPVSDDWTVTLPFEPKLMDGKLWGRGTADDKGPAMAALYAMRAVRELGIPITKNVRLILGCDEECGSHDIAYYYQKESAAPMTFSPDANFPVVNIEKGHWIAEVVANFADDVVVSVHAGTKFNVIPGQAQATLRGVSIDLAQELAKQVEENTGLTILCEPIEGGVEITCKGISGHAASPEHANNALTGLLEYLAADALQASPVWKQLSANFPHGDYAGNAMGIAMTHPKTGALTMCADMITYKVGALHLCFDSRMPLTATPDNTEAIVRKKLAAFGAAVTTTAWSDTHYVDENSWFVQTLLRCYEMYSGKKGFCMSMGGGTYVHNVENGVAFGCVEDEDETNLHSGDEHIAVADLLQGSAIFAQAIIELCR